MASREDILPGEDKNKSFDTNVGFGYLSMFFIAVAIVINWTSGRFNPVLWIQSYSKFWVFFTLPYLAIRNGSMDR